MAKGSFKLVKVWTGMAPPPGIVSLAKRWARPLRFGAIADGGSVRWDCSIPCVAYGCLLVGRSAGRGRRRARSRAPASRCPLVWVSVDGDGCAQVRSMRTL